MGQLRTPPPTVHSRGEAKADFPAHGVSQLLQKAWLRPEFMFPKYNRHVSRSVSAPRSVKAGQRCLRALLCPCLLSVAVTVPPPHQQRCGRFGFIELSD